jgi:hypothetical protein
MFIKMCRSVVETLNTIKKLKNENLKTYLQPEKQFTVCNTKTCTDANENVTQWRSAKSG